MTSEDVPHVLRTAVRHRLGLVFSDARTATFTAGVARALQVLDEGTPERLAARVAAGDAHAIGVLASEITIGESYFFRDPGHFALLSEQVLRGKTHVRLWSAGCATGEEAYTLAIAAIEAGVTPEVIATDLNPAFLARARSGTYGPWSFRGVPERIRRTWFEGEGRHVRVLERVRQHVRFVQGNLLESATAPRDVDAAFCRNVLIYFDAPAILAAAVTLRDALRPEGWLFTGPSDPLLEIEGLRIELRPGVIVHRRGEQALVIPEAALPAASPAPLATARTRSQRPLPRAETRASALPTEPPTDAFARAQVAVAARAPDEALQLLDAFLATPTFDAEPWILRATLRQDRGDDAGALDDLRRALLIDRDLPVAHLLRAGALRRLGEAAAAARSLARARVLARALENPASGPARTRSKP